MTAVAVALILTKIHGASAARAVIHPRHHEEALELRDATEAAIRRNYSLEVIYGAAREDELVRPAVIRDDLSAMATEAGKIRIVSTDDLVKLLSRLLEPGGETGDIQSMPIEAGVLLNPEPPVIKVAVGTTIADRPPHGSARALISACGSYRR